MAGPALGGIVKVAQGTKKALDFIQSFNGVEEEGYVLWKTLDSLAKPLQVAQDLMCRHEALCVFEGPVSLVKFLIARVECILEKDEVEGDERPAGKESWSKWLQHKKDGKERKERILEMLPKLNGAVTMLNLAMNTLACQPALCARVQPDCCFYFVPDAFAQARRLLQEFVFGRVTSQHLCGGVFWSKEVGSSSSAVLLQNMGACHVVLERQQGGNGVQLRFRCAENAADDEEADDFDDREPWADEIVKITKAKPALERRTRGNAGSLLPDVADGATTPVVYKVGDCVLEFAPEGTVSAEMFEALLVMAKVSNSLEDEVPDENFERMMSAAGMAF